MKKTIFIISFIVANILLLTACVTVTTTEMSTVTAPPVDTSPEISTSSIFVNAIDSSMVLVTDPSGKYHSTGMAVGDGSQVLTTWDFEESAPDSFIVSIPGKQSFNAIILAFDSRTSAVLLNVEGLKLPVTPIGELPTSEKPVIIKEWYLDKIIERPGTALGDSGEDNFLKFPVSFKRGEPPGIPRAVGTGGVVIDETGKVLGLAGIYYNHFFWTGFSPFYGTLIDGGTVAISAALDLLKPGASENLWSQGPIQVIIAVMDSGTSLPDNTFSTYGKMTVELANIAENLGEPISEDELDKYSIAAEHGISVGTTLTAIYASPIDLSTESGVIVAKAKWIAVQWGRDEGLPVLLFYGDEPQKPLGGFIVDYDISDLIRATPYNG